MTRTHLFLSTFLSLDRIFSCTKKTANALVPLLLLPFFSVAQNGTAEGLEARTSSRLVFVNTACFPAGTNLSILGENPMFVDVRSNGGTQGIMRLGMLEKVQLDVTNEGIVARANGDVQSLPMWGMKLRVLGSEDGRTVIAALFRGSLGGVTTDSWPNPMGSIAPSSAAKGLVRYHYTYDVAYAAFLFSYGLSEHISLHGGLDAQQIRIYNAELDLMPPAPADGAQAVPLVIRRSEINGFLGVVVKATPRVSVVGELQSLPELAPSDDVSTIDVYRAYRSAVAIKYEVKSSLTVFTNAARVFLPVGNNFVEVRLGAEATISLQ